MNYDSDVYFLRGILFAGYWIAEHNNLRLSVRIPVFSADTGFRMPVSGNQCSTSPNLRVRPGNIESRHRFHLNYGPWVEAENMSVLTLFRNIRCWRASVLVAYGMAVAVGIAPIMKAKRKSCQLHLLRWKMNECPQFWYRTRLRICSTYYMSQKSFEASRAAFSLL